MAVIGLLAGGLIGLAMGKIFIRGRKWMVVLLSLAGAVMGWGGAFYLQSTDPFASQDRPVWSLGWSVDGKVLASTSDDETVRFWEVATGRESFRLEEAATGAGHPRSRLGWRPEGGPSVAWSPDGRMLASTRYDTIRLWDAATGSEIRPFQGHETWVQSACWSPDGKIIASVGHHDKTIRLWGSDIGTPIRTLKGHQRTVHAVAWSPDGKTLASGSEDRTVRLWDPGTGNEIRQLTGDWSPATSMTWSPDGKTLATLESAQDSSTVRLLDLATGKEMRRFAVAVGLHSIVWSPDGRMLDSISLADRTFRLWDLSTGKEVRQIRHDDDSYSLTWSPDGKTLASEGRGFWTTGDERTVHVWEVATGKEVSRFAERDTRSMAWSPDGRSLATSSWGVKQAGHWEQGGEKILWWDVGTGKELGRLPASYDHVNFSLTWSPDGKRLASASQDDTVLIWDIGRQPDEPTIHLEPSELEACWADLAEENPAPAYQAIHALSQAPSDTIPFLAKRLAPAPPADAKVISRLIEDLDSDEFATREKAGEELVQLAELAEPALRLALENNPTPESRRRLEQLLSKLNDWSGERLRARRATTVLENIGTAKARLVLQELAKGAPAAQYTQEANASLQRLAKRPFPAPLQPGAAVLPHPRYRSFAAEQADIKEIIARAIKAHGGEENLARYPAATYKFRRKLYGYYQGQSYTGEVTSNPPERSYYESVRDDGKGNHFTYTRVIDGDRGWSIGSGRVENLTEHYMSEYKEELYTDWLCTLLPLRNSEFTLKSLGDAKVGDHETVGIKVSKKGHLDVALYFDKESGALRKIGTKRFGGIIAPWETIIEEYKEAQGIKYAHKVTVNEKGSPYLAEEITDFQPLEKVDEKKFAYPSQH
jgi:WD40 repeat protein